MMRCLFLAAALMTATPAISKLCTVKLDNGEQLTAPAALALHDQVKGLSGKNQGNKQLIMAWDKPDVRAVWMKDTPMPLTAAFIGIDGRIQSIQEMQPETNTAHSSLHPVIAIIEVSPAISAQLKWTRETFVVASDCFSIQ